MDTSKFTKGLVGQFYDTSLRVSISLAAEEIIPIGVPLMRGTDPERQVKKFNGGISTEMVGVAGYSKLQLKGNFSLTQTQGYYEIGDVVTVVQQGRLWIPLTGSQTITEGDTAYIDTLFDKITNVYVDEFSSIPIGRFRTSGVSATYDPIVFVLELIPGYAEEIPAGERLNVEDETSTTESNINLKAKTREKK